MEQTECLKKCQHFLEYQKYLLPGDICGQFHKTFLSIIHAAIRISHLVLTQVTQLGGVNYAEKSFMKLKPMANFIKPFSQ
jgi:hypothetical protein